LLFNKKKWLTLNFDSVASSGNQEKLTYLLHVLPLASA